MSEKKIGARPAVSLNMTRARFATSSCLDRILHKLARNVDEQAVAAHAAAYSINGLQPAKAAVVQFTHGAGDGGFETPRRGDKLTFQ